MHSFPIIHTDRLTLRKLETADLSDLIQKINNPAISKQIFNIPYPYSEADAIARLHLVTEGFRSKKRYIFLITNSENQELMGEISLHLDRSNNRAETGFWLDEKKWGNGYMTEALRAILDFGFKSIQLQKIFATHYPENPASGKVLQKAGMIKEAELKDHYLVEGEYRTVMQYRLTKDEFDELSMK